MCFIMKPHVLVLIKTNTCVGPDEVPCVGHHEAPCVCHDEVSCDGP